MGHLEKVNGIWVLVGETVNVCNFKYSGTKKTDEQEFLIFLQKYDKLNFRTASKETLETFSKDLETWREDGAKLRQKTQRKLRGVVRQKSLG